MKCYKWIVWHRNVLPNDLMVSGGGGGGGGGGCPGTLDTACTADSLLRAYVYCRFPLACLCERNDCNVQPTLVATILNIVACCIHDVHCKLVTSSLLNA